MQLVLQHCCKTFEKVLRVLRRSTFKPVGATNKVARLFFVGGKTGNITIQLIWSKVITKQVARFLLPVLPYLIIEKSYKLSEKRKVLDAYYIFLFLSWTSKFNHLPKCYQRKRQKWILSWFFPLIYCHKWVNFRSCVSPLRESPLFTSGLFAVISYYSADNHQISATTKKGDSYKV